MVDARLEILIVARDRFRRVLQQISQTVTRVREGVRRLDRTPTNRIARGFLVLRNRARLVGQALVRLGARLRAINQATFGRVIRGFRALRASTAAATRSAGALRGALAPFIGAAALIAGIFGATRVLAGFEQQMAAVRAITGATEEQFELLEAEARRLGATTRFTAQQAADALEFLARAGFSAEDAAAALEGTLNLASAGMLGLGEAADIVSNVLQQFGLDADLTGEVVDILAVTAANSNTNVRQLGDAFKFVGPIAKSLGITVKDTAELIGLLGNAGIQASNAGAGLRRVLIGLVNQTPKAEKAIRELGLTTDDLQLTGTNTAEVFALLGERSLSVAQAVDIFGIRGSTVALALADATRQASSLTAALDDFDGGAKAISDTIEDTLLGDFRRLISAFQEIILQAGDEGVTGALRSLITGLTVIVQALDGTAETADNASAGFAAIARAVAALINTFQALSDFGVIERILEPLIAALDAISELVLGISARFRELGAIPADVTDEVVQSLDILRNRIEDASDLSTLDAFIASSKINLRRFNDEILAINQELAGDITRSERGELLIRLQAQRTAQAREAAIIVGANKLRREIVEQGAKAETDARRESQAEQIEDIKVDNEARLALLEARTKAVQASTKREVAAFRQAAAELEAIEKLRIAQGLPPLENFLEQRQQLLTSALDAEVRAQRDIISRIQEEGGIRELLAADQEEIEQIRTEAAAELIKAQTRLNALRSEQVLQANQFAVEAAKATNDLTRIVEAAQRAVSTTTAVEDFTVIRERLEADFNKTIRNMEVTAEQADLFEKALDVRVVDALLQQTEAAFKASTERLNVTEDTLARQRETRQISQVEFQDRIREAQQLTIDEQTALLGPLLELETQGIQLREDQLLQIEKLKNGVQVLADTTLPILGEIRDAFAASFGRFVEDLVTGTKTAKEAFRDFAKDVLVQIQKIIVQQLVLNAISAAFGGAGGGGGGGAGATVLQLSGSFKKGGVVKFAGGGEVKGRGTGTSDSILARVSKGEYVEPAAVTRKYLPFLEAMRQGKFERLLAGKGITLGPVRMPRIPRFQGGGLVEPKQTTGTGGEQRSLRIINIPDASLTQDFLTSSEGEDVLLNFITNRAENIKRLLA